jgi:hypothetical protein
MRKLIFLAVLVAVPAGATEVYRWVDANGQTHYSDQWQPGAEKVRIEQSPVYSAPAARPGAKTTGSSQPAAAGPRYDSLEILSPAQEEVLWNIGGQVRVALQLTPALRTGDVLRLFLDGEPQEVAAGSMSAELTDVARGVHTLKATVTNEAGKTLIESDPTTFVVRQTSIQNPQNPLTRPIPTPRG